MSTRKTNQRIRNIIKQGRLGKLDDEKKTQELQVEFIENEVVEEMERFQNYGFSSRPTEGGVLALNMGGRGNHIIAICINDDESRTALEDEWDVAIYHKEGHKLVLTKDGVARLTCKKFIVDAEDEIEMNTKSTTINTDTMAINASESVVIDTPQTTITGKATVEGHFTFMSGLTGYSGGSARNAQSITARIYGDINITGISRANDHLSNGISGSSHKHSGVETGGGETGAPK